MATESVKILIEAEDQASAKIAAASREVENRIKNIKDVGGKAKASTEFIGTLVGSLGGSEIAGFASQLGGLTEKVSAFSEVQKAGGAGALAFKAGLVAAAGAIAFQIGNALGNVIFQTEKWTEALKKATDESKKLEAAAASLRSERFSDTQADIELIRDPEKKRAEYEKLLGDLKTNIVGVEGQVRSSQKAVQEWDEAWQITGDRKGFAEQSKLQLEQDKERLKQLQEQQKEIQRLIGIEAEREQIRQRNAGLDADEQYLASLDKQLAKLQAINADSKIDLQINMAGMTNVERLKQEIELIENRQIGLAALQEEAKQSTSGFVSDDGVDGQKEAEAKLLQIKLLEKQNELQKLVADERRQQLKEIADLEFNSVMAAEKAFIAERDRLAEQKVLLEQGAEAAHAMRLAKQGISEEDAKSFAAQQAELDNQKQVQEKMKARESAQPLQAVSSRFLTRGPVDDKMLDVAKTQLKVQQEQLAELKKPKPEGPKMRDVRLVEVG